MKLEIAQAEVCYVCISGAGVEGQLSPKEEATVCTVTDTVSMSNANIATYDILHAEWLTKRFATTLD